MLTPHRHSLILLLLLNFGILSGYSATGFTNKLTIPPLSQEEFLYSFEIKWSTTSDTQTGDGQNRPIVVINGGIPGPSIVVWKNSTVIVNVKNFLNETTTIHWHGLDMRDQFWYDGVPNINQCPIRPGDTFQYRIKVNENPGTYWYHSHVGSQRGDGCYGVFVILDKEKSQAYEENQEFVLLLTDWWQETAANFDNDDNSKTIRNAVGQMVSDLNFHSALINGKGQKYGDPDYPQGQTEILKAQKKPIKLRVVHVGMMWSLILQVAGYRLKFLASDGYDMTGKQIVDRVVLNSGERYDFQLINIDGQCDSLDRRQIRISTLADSFDDGTSPENINYFHSDAILECITDELKDGENPVCQIQNCSATTPCQVLNCPFKQYPKAVANVTCINPHEFDSAKLLPDTLQKTDPDDEIFLNIGGIESDSNFHFNNIRMKPANYPPYEEILQGGNLGNVAEVCQADCGDKKECECFKPLVLQPKNLTQIVIYNKIDSSNSANVSMGHPIHIHGQHMYVVKVGYSTTDAQDMVDEVNKDITCKNFNCANGDWVNKTRGRTEGYNLVNPAFKDTIYVPYGGYVVLRSIPSNIGWFVMHCHMLIHETEGLMIPLKVGTDEEIGAAVKAHRPKDYPVCPNTATLTYGNLILFAWLTVWLVTLL